jgi:hypothetical protein
MNRFLTWIILASTIFVLPLSLLKDDELVGLQSIGVDVDAEVGEMHNFWNV